MEQLLLKFGEVSLRNSQTTCSSCRRLSTTAIRQARPTRRYVDPFAAAQARARKAANISRQTELHKTRTEALGDPVRGKRTPFVEAFDTARAPPPGTYRAPGIKPVDSNIDVEGQTSTDLLNFSVTPTELEASLQRSLIWSGGRTGYDFNTHLDEPGYIDSSAGPAPEEIDRLNPSADRPSHKTATEAIKRIASLANASSKERLSVNIKRCVSTFGRHNTDTHLPPKPTASESFLQSQSAGRPESLPVKTPRAGPDTGSSEVQIAVLTARIRTLSQFTEGRGKQDKMNKRNLRVLVHRRQKLLKYLQRKERGGPRFRNVVEVLGLTPGAWEGEISL